MIYVIERILLFSCLIFQRNNKFLDLEAGIDEEEDYEEDEDNGGV